MSIASGAGGSRFGTMRVMEHVWISVTPLLHRRAGFNKGRLRFGFS